jgi:Uma2 family endonuclease
LKCNIRRAHWRGKAEAIERTAGQSRLAKMVVRRRSGVYTFTDFLELVHEDQKADLIDGEIYLASPENLDHNDLVRWLGTILGQFVEERGLGRLTINRVSYHLGKTTAPEPDLAVVLTDRLGSLRSGYGEGPPDLAVEVVSPESVDRDYEIKREIYETAGVREYWIIDPDEKSAIFLIRETDQPGPFVEAQLDGNQFHSRVIPGSSLKPAWLWQRPLPSTLPIVQSLLAG